MLHGICNIKELWNADVTANVFIWLSKWANVYAVNKWQNLKNSSTMR